MAWIREKENVSTFSRALAIHADDGLNYINFFLFKFFGNVEKMIN